jgi:hypothetical protein
MARPTEAADGVVRKLGLLESRVTVADAPCALVGAEEAGVD